MDRDLTKEIKVHVENAHIRKTNFFEIVQGYKTLQDAQLEASRCLNCRRKPCSLGCPINNDIPEFLDKLAKGDIQSAYEIIRNRSSLPRVCSRVCPQEVQCEGKCTRGIKGDSINIGALERFVCDYADSNNFKPSDKFADYDLSQLGSGKKVAIVGSGPAGIACAYVLSKSKANVTIYESRDYFGGVLAYGIPKFRLANDIVDNRKQELIDNGVEILLNHTVGKDIALAQLVNEYDAVFIANGAQIPKKANIPGEQSKNVYQALELLENVKVHNNHMNIKGKSVIIIGGGNVAMDSAACVTRLGACDVKVVYRRSMDELPARKEEVLFNQQEGVEFKILSSPTVIQSNSKGEVTGVICQEVELGEMDESGRRCPVCKIGSEFTIPADIVILAIGSDQDNIFESLVELDRRKCAVVDDNFKTSHNKIWAGGDTVSCPLTVVNAVNAGQKAALNILGLSQSE